MLKIDKEKPLAALLDKTLVCLDDSLAEKHLEPSEKDFITFSQQSTLTPGSSFEEGTTPQSEVSSFFTYHSLRFKVGLASPGLDITMSQFWLSWQA